jgi:hypothetical protein
MTIYDTNLTGACSTGTTDTSRAQGSQKVDTTGVGQSSSSKGTGDDRVELSGALGRLSQMLSSFQEDRAGRVAALVVQYQSGKYQGDSLATSQGMISDALAAGLQ